MNVRFDLVCVASNRAANISGFFHTKMDVLPSSGDTINIKGNPFVVVGNSGWYASLDPCECTSYIEVIPFPNVNMKNILGHHSYANWLQHQDVVPRTYK